jgi:hypothetical protein
VECLSRNPGDRILDEYISPSRRHGEGVDRGPLDYLGEEHQDSIQIALDFVSVCVCREEGSSLVPIQLWLNAL